MLVPALALMMLFSASTISHAAQPNARRPQVAQPTQQAQRASLTEDEREDLIFEKVVKRRPFALFARAGAKITQFKTHKNLYPQTGSTQCATK